MEDFERHNREIQKNISYWNNKPILQKIYDDFYSTINTYVNRSCPGKIVELGSGIGNLKRHIPECICTDVFDNPWIDQKENAYSMSFEDNSVSNLILFDVWHHLEFPVLALDEFKRVLNNKGRIIIFEPYISLLGWGVYGLFHPEDVAWFKKINLNDKNIDIANLQYYAAQGNATRFFQYEKYKKFLCGLSIIQIKKIAAIAYVLSGGYSKKQMFPDSMYTKIKRFEAFAQKIPSIFGTRLLVILEKM